MPISIFSVSILDSREASLNLSYSILQQPWKDVFKEMWIIVTFNSVILNSLKKKKKSNYNSHKRKSKVADRTGDVQRYKVTGCASPVVPAWFLRHRWSHDGWGGSAAAAVVAAPAQRRAIWAAGRRSRAGRRVSGRPQAEHRGGGFIFVELFRRWLETRGRNRRTALATLESNSDVQVNTH